MRLSIRATLLLIVLAVTRMGVADVASTWPQGQGMAVSLSYDDALDSQLDVALPALDRHGFKASFYLTLASPVVQQRLHEWRTAAANGHELGNHTVHHPCRASLPGRDWVASHNDLDRYELERIVNEVRVANSFLHAIDGRHERTFTPPCGDRLASGDDYLPHVRDQFVAIKGYESDDPAFSSTWSPAGQSGAELIERVESEASRGTRLLNIVFHGVGGDYLAISTAAHQDLLAYLAIHRERFLTGTYLEIMRQQAER